MREILRNEVQKRIVKPRGAGTMAPKSRGSDRQTAVVYLRTSSAANVGEEKDSATRQRLAATRYAAAAGLEIVAEFTDEAVSGADPVETRPGFAAMLARIEGNGVRLVIVEDASRFARSVLAQELGVLIMAERGVRIVTASGEDLTNTDDPAKVMMRQVAAAFAQYEKARLVGKLRGARDRASERLGRRVEGRKGYADTRPELVKEAKRLARKSPKTGKRRSLREIAAELAGAEYVTIAGRPFSASQVRRLIAA
jgi:DNA invertase Pin-like site-specific DNA recombinase